MEHNIEKGKHIGNMGKVNGFLEPVVRQYKSVTAWEKRNRQQQSEYAHNGKHACTTLPLMIAKSPT